MKKDDFDDLKQQLKNLEEEVERLKKENPDDDYEEIDKTIEEFRKMVSDGNIKKFERKILRKRIVGLVLNYFFHIITTLSILGFCGGFLNEANKSYLGIVVPILALILFIYRKLSNVLIFKGPLQNHKILYTLSLYFVFVCILGIIDFYLLNIWTSIWNSILTLIIIGFVLEIGEFIYYHKLVMKYKR